MIISTVIVVEGDLPQNDLYKGTKNIIVGVFNGRGGLVSRSKNKNLR
jgi:hypothetical protein